MMPEFYNEPKNCWKTVFFRITSIFGHNSGKKGGIDLCLVSFCLDSCKILQWEKKLKKNSIMADFGLKKDNFGTNFIVITLFLSNGCFILWGFVFLRSIHLSSNKRKIQVSIMSGYLTGTRGSYARFKRASPTSYNY